jgi:hypothetical protein
MLVKITAAGARGIASATSSVKRPGTGPAAAASSDTGLAAAAKLGQAARDKERREKEDVELKPPWELPPYSRDPSAGNRPPTLIPRTVVIGIRR